MSHTNPPRRPRRAANAVPCIDGGRHHAWESTGLDVIEDTTTVVVSTGRCVWCGVTATRPYPGPGIRPGVRLRPY